MNLARLTSIVLLLGVAACSGESGTGPPPASGGASQLQYSSGNQQVGVAGFPLPDSLTVRVVDGNGAGVRDLSVTFAVTAGGGTLSPATVSTDAQGFARVAWTLGAQEGENGAEARAAGLAGSSVVFRATGEAALLDVTARPLAAGGYFSCGITAAGAAHCWGRNQDGELGDGSHTDRGAPAAVSGGLVFAAVSGGIFHACGLTRSAAVYCWGENSSGQLGDRSTTSRTAPVRVPSRIDFVSVSAGWLHSCGLTRSGRAHCWGDNEHGQLGNGSRTASSTPVPVAGELRFLALEVGGGHHSCGRVVDGTVYCWGSNEHGQLGAGSLSPGSTTPLPVAGGRKFRMVDLGAEHTCGIAEDGATYCWGLNRHGQLGDGTTSDRNVPTAVLGAPGFVFVEAGTAHHTCALTAAGEAYCWGANEAGELGDGSFVDRSIPVAVEGALEFVTVQGGDFHTCGRTASGTAYCWGENSSGQLGDGSWTRTTQPVPVAGGLVFGSTGAGVSAAATPSSLAGSGGVVTAQPARIARIRQERHRQR